MKSSLPVLLTVWVALALGGCVKAQSFNTTNDTQGTSDSLQVDVSADISGDLEGEVDVGLDVLGPTCHEALICLVNLKNWNGGPVPTQSDCLVDINHEEMDDVDGVLSCIEAQCSAEFEAFDLGGQAELGALTLCLVEHCAEPYALCAGGQGDDDCGDALWCLAGCNPLDPDCTSGCIAGTSQDQAAKTGKFLNCVLDKCPLDNFEVSCVPTTCALLCPEVI